MSKVLVDRELLEQLQEKLDPHRDAVLWGDVCDALRRAQPAEAEGVEVVAWLNTAAEAVTVHPVQVMDWDDEGEPVESLVRQADHRAALSAVTAERDRLRELSVERILLDVVPGDGEGHEVYAKSVEEVVAALTTNAERADVLEAERAKLRAETEGMRKAISALIDIAHEHRHELLQQRFPDNDEGDALARHRDARVARIAKIMGYRFYVLLQAKRSLKACWC